jgi:hypothetical protein
VRYYWRPRRSNPSPFPLSPCNPYHVSTACGKQAAAYSGLHSTYLLLQEANKSSLAFFRPPAPVAARSSWCQRSLTTVSATQLRA